MKNKYFPIICTGAFYGYQYIIRILPSVTMNSIVEKFGVSSVAFGQYSGIYYIGYAAAHLPFGALIDKMGIRLVFLISLLMSFLGIMPITYSDSWQMMLIGRFISGFGTAGAALTMIKVIGDNFKDSFSKVFGLTATFGLICAIFGGKPIILLIDNFGINFVINGMILIGLALFALGLMIKQNQPKSNTSMLKSLKDVLFNYEIYILCLLGGLMIGSLEGFADMWASEFFKESKGMEIGNAALLCSMAFLGMGIGCPLVGYISDKSQKYNLVIAACGIIMSISFGIILLDISNFYLISLLMVIIGIASAYQIPLIGKAGKMAKNNAFALTTSFTNMLIMSFGYIFHSLIGHILDISGSITKAVSIVPIFCVIGTIGIVINLMREKSNK